MAASSWRAWPPRLPEQPIFYPVLNRWYATKITREWNVPHGGVGYVTRFDVRKDYLDRFPVQQAGGRDVLEYWIPAEDLDEFNANITGAIREEALYLGPVQTKSSPRWKAASAASSRAGGGTTCKAGPGSPEAGWRTAAT